MNTPDQDAVKEMVRLANIALADVGEPQCVYVSPSVRDRTPAPTWPPAHTSAARKACLLAALKVAGPGLKCGCIAHINDPIECGMVTISDALMNRTCGVS